MIAGSDVPYHFVIVIEYFISVAGDCLVEKFNAYNFACHAFVEESESRFFADEFRLVKLYKYLKPGFEWLHVVGKLISIERECHFKAQCVAASESAGFHFA